MIQQEITLVPLQQPDLATLQAWFSDEELSRRLGGMLPLQNYFDYLQSEPAYFAWMARQADTAVGAAFLQVAPDEEQGFAILVQPALRSHGYGRAIVHKLMAQPEAAAMPEWKAEVEPDNVAGQRCLAAVGFVPENGLHNGLHSSQEHESGFLRYIYKSQL